MAIREIIFRGKRVDNGEWVEGYYVCISETYHYILTGNPVVEPGKIDVEHYKVYPETVGEYTGLTDKNGVKTFEGDIIKTHYANTPKPNYTETVVFYNGRFCAFYNSGSVSWHSGLYDGVQHLNQDKTVYMDSFEVIGNIHDNKEILNVK